jgi:hypothetical protein
MPASFNHPKPSTLRRCKGLEIPKGGMGTYEAAHSTLGVEFSLFYEGFDQPVAKLQRISSGQKTGMLPGISISQECGQC